MVKSSIKNKKQANSTVLPVSEKYNIWLDTSLDNFDYEKELQQEYKDLMKSARKSPYFNAGMDRAYHL